MKKSFWKNKKVVVFHGGGKFRLNHKAICSQFNPIVDCSLIQTYDLFGLGAKDERWLLPPIDLSKIKPEKLVQNRLEKFGSMGVFEE